MNSVQNLLPLIKKDFPDITFESGEKFLWWPKDNKIIYTSHHTNVDHGIWALFHELAHASLGHKNYSNDFELIKLESATWQKAKILAKKYGIEISNDHIQDCLDTYRDWLHGRACCPKCQVVSLQSDDRTYRCFNCKTRWRVPKSQDSLVIRKTVLSPNKNQTR
jgi:hypothetical protein